VGTLGVQEEVGRGRGAVLISRERGRRLEKKELTGGVGLAGRERGKGLRGWAGLVAGLNPSRVGPGCPFLYIFFFFFLFLFF
jgi:hypothetical protein